VVVNNLDVMGVAVLPGKACAPLVIDPDTVLTGPPAFELLQPIARRDSQILQVLRSVQSNELSQHEFEQIGWETSDGLAVKQPLSGAVRKTLDHLQS
jgi:hypothetical protein